MKDMRRRQDDGLALLLALLVLAILILLITQMSITSLQNRTVADNHLGDLQNSYAARSGYHLGVIYLMADLEKEPEADSLLQPSLGIPPGVERPVEAGKPED